MVKTYSGYGESKTERGISLSLPIQFTNMDYNIRGDTVLPRLSVQFEDGRVFGGSEYATDDAVTISCAYWQDKPDEVAMLAAAIPGKSTRTLVLEFDVAARMIAETGLNVRRLLLYLHGVDGFRGFVVIPDDVWKTNRCYCSQRFVKGRW